MLLKVLKFVIMYPIITHYVLDTTTNLYTIIDTNLTFQLWFEQWNIIWKSFNYR